jgi:hypothetical protein
MVHSRIMTEGFKVGGVDGHPVVNGSAAVSYLLVFLLLMSEGYGVYTNNDPGSSFSYCGPVMGRNSQIIALRCLPGTCGEIGSRNIHNAVGSPRGTLVLKTSEQCLVTYANKNMLTGSPATLFILPHRPLLPLMGFLRTRKDFATCYKMRQRLCL